MKCTCGSSTRRWRASRIARTSSSFVPGSCGVSWSIARGARNAVKRDGGEREELEVALEVESGVGPEVLDVLALDEALERLAARDARKAQVVELRYFSGLSIAEVAEALDVSTRTVEMDWFFARAWLRRELQDSRD